VLPSKPPTVGAGSSLAVVERPGDGLPAPLEIKEPHCQAGRMPDGEVELAHRCAAFPLSPSPSLDPTAGWNFIALLAYMPETKLSTISRARFGVAPPCGAGATESDRATVGGEHLTLARQHPSPCRAAR